MKNLKFTLLFFLCVLVFVLNPQKASSNEPISKKKANKKYQNLKLFSDVLYTIEKAYVKEVSEDQLIHSAIEGVMKELDPHSYFLPPSHLSNVKEQALKPKPEQKKDFKTRFNLWNNLSVSKKNLKGDILYLRIPTWTKHTYQEIQKILNKKLKPTRAVNEGEAFTQKEGSLVSKGEASSSFGYTFRGMILDLRGNEGGLFDSAVRVADLFIKEGTIVNIKGRGAKHNRDIKANALGTLPDFPLVVLIDTHSASATEVLAGALKDHKRAVLLGKKTFGKGSVQSFISLEHGGGLQLTVAYYLTPLGHAIHNKGITPDIKLSQTAPPAWPFAKDSALKKALSVLNSLK